MKKIKAALALFAVSVCAGIILTPEAVIETSKVPAQPKEERLAVEMTDAMTLEQQVGQMFLVCVSDKTINKAEIQYYGLGGYLFFADFFKSRSKKDVAEDIASYQEAASIPMFMAVDEEGGTVVRVSKYKNFRRQPFLSPQKLYKQGGLDKIRADCSEKCRLLLSLGLNVNLAPVCDMTTDKKAFIYPRTLGAEPKLTARYTAAVVKEMNSMKMGSALKHFPGYGGNGDTHTGITRDTREYEAFEARDFLPFETAIDAGAPCVLISHNIVESMDKDKPASLSKNVHDILRNQLNFDKVILTDDLIMDGVQGYSGEENIAVAAVKAGNDLLCSSEYRTQIPAIVKAVEDGEISREQIRASVIRILKWKLELDLFDKK